MRPAGVVAFLLYSFLLLSPNLLALFTLGDAAMIQGQTGDDFQTLGYALGAWALWCALVGRMFWACLLALPFMLMVPIELYLEAEYHTRLLPHVFGIAHDTDLAEATEFLQGRVLSFVLPYLALIAVAIGALVVLRRMPLRWRGRTRALVGVPLLLLPLVIHFVYAEQDVWGNKLVPRPDEFRIAPLPPVLHVMRDTFPFGLPLRYLYYRESLDLLSQIQEKTRNFRFGAAQTPAVDEREIFVLVIGESARYDRWTVNGYKRATSPRLSAEKNLVSFADMVSLSTVTRLAVPVLVTRKPARAVLGSTFHERSFISAFKEAGFATYWLSTQTSINRHDTPISQYAREADHQRFLNVSVFDTYTPFDGVLVPIFKEALQDKSPKVLIVLHTLGSHTTYWQRYPDEFAKFSPTPPRNAKSTWTDRSLKEQIENAYDNTILYTDHVLGELIDSMRNSDRKLAAMMYVSDHGEDLFDFGCVEAGHGRATVASYRVPAFFWYSDAYGKRYPQKIGTLARNRTAPLTTESIFPTMVDSADIRFPKEDLTLSALSPTLRTHPRMVATIAGKSIDFDHAHLTKDCELAN